MTATLIGVSIVLFAIALTRVIIFLCERHDNRKYQGGFEQHFML